MTSAGPTVADPPVMVETLPRWLTLGEAAFISGVEEEALQAWVTSGSIRCDRSLSRRLGDHYLLVLSDDLVAAGLLQGPGEPSTVEEDEPEPAPPPAASTAASPATAMAAAPAPAPPSAPPPVPARPTAPAPTRAPARAQPVAPAPARAPGSLADAYVASPPPDEPDDVASAAPTSLPSPSAAWLLWATVRPMIRQILRWSVVGLLLGLLFAALLPLAFRYRMFPVKSASMAPALHSGDLMLVRPIPANKVRVGDVVAMRDPTDGRVVAGRVRSLRPSAAALHIQTETDASRSIRLWTVPLGGSLEVVRYRVAKLGSAISWLPAKATRWIPYGLPGVVFVVFLVFAIHARRASARTATVPAT